MSNFTVPFSSSLPSTPDTRQRSHKSKSAGSLGSNPSTTPVDSPNPVPGSFTPAGPPPSSPFGSSQLATVDAEVNAKSTFASFGFGAQSPEKDPFARRQRSSPPLPPFFGRTRNGSPAKPMLAWPDKSMESPLGQSGSDGDDEDDEEDDSILRGIEDRHFAGAAFSSNRSAMSVSLTKQFDDGPAARSSHNDKRSPPRGTKRLHTGKAVERPQDISQPYTAGSREQSAIPSIAQDLAGRSGVALLQEPDYIILRTEALMARLDHLVANTQENESTPDKPLSHTSGRLLELWQSASASKSSGADGPGDEGAGIGPWKTAPPFEKATFLAGILLPLRHPPPLKASNIFPQSRASRSLGFSRSFDSRAAGKPLPIPKVLLNWLNVHHDPFRNTLAGLSSHQPNPTHHTYFWDITLSGLLRGKLEEVIRVFKQADFRHYPTAMDDNEQSQVSETQLAGIRVVVSRAIQILEHCPAFTDGDWDITGDNWAIFRHRVSQAERDLNDLAGGADLDGSSTGPIPFSAEHFGIQSKDTKSLSLTRASRQVDSKVPWSVYQSMKALYGILVGNATEIIALAQDWVEATLGLTIWWNAEHESPHSASPWSLKGKASSDQPASLENTQQRSLYLERLAWSFHRATVANLDDTFQIDTLNHVEVGLASIFEGNIEGTIGLLRGWSLVVASAVIQVAKYGGWLNQSHNGNILGEFDPSDLMVLSYDQLKTETWKDDVLVDYAQSLFGRELLRGEDTNGNTFIQSGADESVRREGWELGILVLGRLDDMRLCNKKLGELLESLPLDSTSRVDKLLRICREIGLEGRALNIAEKYADSLAEHSYNYGETVLYYAYAHKQKKVKNVLDLLVSFCLVQSAAYPPEAELDQNLERLVTSPNEALKDVAMVDFEAADLIEFYMSGYATIRAFYNLRDEEVNLKPGQKPKVREMARKRQALATVLTLIASAADDIHGGLYDESRESAIFVDGLLVLLGEAMVFVDQPKCLVTLPQAFNLLKAIEDLQTVTPRIYSQCEALFNSAIQAERGSQGPSPRAPLKKSTSMITSSSGFSMIGSSMLGNQGHGRMAESSEVMAKTDIKRGWDWRKNLPKKVTGKYILQVLRQGLGREIAKGWLDREDGF